MSGVLSLMAALSGPMTLKTITIGDDGVPQSYGYSNGSYGSLSPNATYNDHGGTSRTILAIGYNTSTGGLVLTLSGVITNNDTVFSAIVINGVSYLRSSATYSASANSSWTWTPGSNVIGTSGSRVFSLL